MPVNKEQSSRNSGKASGIDKNYVGSCTPQSIETPLLFPLNSGFSGLKKPLVRTAAQSCSALKLSVRVSPLALYSYRNEIYIIKLSHCMMPLESVLKVVE
jgi:hypothetical protein